VAVFGTGLHSGDIAKARSTAVRVLRSPSTAREDLVAGLAGDIELPAQHRHLLPIQQPSHKPQPFVHPVTLPPRHLRVPRKMPEGVTYVPGGMD